MSQMSMSAVETRSAVVCSGQEGVCRRFVSIVIDGRLHGSEPLQMQNSH